MDDGVEERRQWLTETRDEIVGEADLAYGGSESWFLLQEVGRAYIFRLYISTVFLCAAVVEQMLFSVLVGQQIVDRDAKLTLGAILTKTEEHDLLSADEAANVRTLKQNRTAFYHYRDLDHEDAPLRQVLESVDELSAEERKKIEDAQREAAQSAIVTMLEIGMKPYDDWYYRIDGRELSVNRFGGLFDIERL